MNSKNYKQLEEQIVQLVNNSGLPIAGAYYLLKSILLELEILYTKDLLTSPETVVEQEEPIMPYDISESQQQTQAVENSKSNMN